MMRWFQFKVALWGSTSTTTLRSAGAIDPRLALPSFDANAGAPDEPPSQRYRAIFISDIHLGTRGCKASFLLDFLRHNESDTLYLVGDIIDG